MANENVMWFEGVIAGIDFSKAEPWLDGMKWEPGHYRFEIVRAGYSQTRSNKTQLAILLKCHGPAGCEGREYTIYQNIDDEKGVNWCFGLLQALEPRLLQTMNGGQINFNALSGGGQFAGAIFDCDLANDVFVGEDGTEKVRAKVVPATIKHLRSSPALEGMLANVGVQQPAMAQTTPVQSVAQPAAQPAQPAVANPTDGLPTM